MFLLGSWKADQLCAVAVQHRVLTMRLDRGQVVRVCPFTYFQAHIWENTVFPKAEYLVCACISWALGINVQCQGRSASRLIWGTPLFTHLMGGRDTGKVSGSPFQLSLAVLCPTLVQTPRFLWCSFSLLSPKRSFRVHIENYWEWWREITLRNLCKYICFDRRGPDNLFHHGTFFCLLWFNLRWEMSQFGREGKFFKSLQILWSI